MDGEFEESVTYLDHAKERMVQRGITPLEVEQALDNASVTTAWKIPGSLNLVGSTLAGRQLRITRLEFFPVVISVVPVGESGA